MAEDHSPPRARRSRKGYEEVVVAAVLLVGAVFFRLRIDSFVIGRQGAYLDPNFWPGALLTVGIVLSAVYLVLAIRWARREGEAERAPVPVTTSPPALTGAESATTATAAAAPATAAVTNPSHGATAVEAAGPAADPVPHPDQEHTGSALKMIVGFLLLAAYIYLLDPIGFIPASLLFAVGFMMLVGERRWYVLLLFPVVAITALLGIFTQLLVVALPRGSGIFVDLSTYFY